MANLGILKSEFPRLRQRLDFGEFHPDLAGNSVDVWLNLTVEFEQLVEKHQEIYREFEKDLETLEGEGLERRIEEMKRATAEIYAELWDCGPEDYLHLISLDAALTNWLLKRTWAIIGDYRQGRLAKAQSG